MKKFKKGRKFGRKKDQRDALMSLLSANFISKEKIKTTEAKAKELSKFVEKQITRAKDGGLHALKILSKGLSLSATRKLIKEIAPRCKERKGGYTRIIKTGQRKSDGAKMAIIELVDKK